RSIGELPSAAELESMLRDGVELVSTARGKGDYLTLVTSDPAVAERYGMIDETEFWDGNLTGQTEE
ncbi:MAG TPA: hypothetical protein VHB77_10880, partial [Planctomycetaceae bacterium]|nr:hypothetical protein [Planctomycetaceae bacterium]